MIVVCPQCNIRNRLPDVIPTGKRYRCYRCKGLLPVATEITHGDAKPVSTSRQGVGRPGLVSAKLVGAVILCLALLGLVGGTAWAVADKARLQSMDSMDIVMYPNEILRKQTEPVEKVGEEERALAALMENTMVKVEGAGLAAPQVGVSKRIIVVNLGRPSATGLSQVYEACSMVNPEIVKREGSATEVESCLSLPKGEHVDVTRSERILVKYTNLEGQEAVLEAVGQNARQIQHEIDHLDGILILDYSERLHIDTKILAAASIWGVTLLVAICLYTRNRIRQRMLAK